MSSQLNDEMPVADGGTDGVTDSATTFAQRRPERPHSNLNDDMPDVGSRYAGQPRDSMAKVRGAQTRTQMVVIGTGLAIVCAVGGLYAVTTRTVQEQRSPVAVAKDAEAETITESQVVQGEIVVDSSPAAGALEVVVPIEAPPTGAVVQAGGPGGNTPVQAGALGALPPAGATPATGPHSGVGTTAGTTDLLPPPAPLADHRRVLSPDATGDVPALGEPGGELAPKRVGQPTRAERLARVEGFGKAAGEQADHQITARFAARRSSLAPAARSGGTVVSVMSTVTNAVGAAGAAGVQALANGQYGSCAQGVSMVPGTRVVAAAVVGSPSATSGEALEAVLNEPLVVRGAELLPAGTIAYGIGKSFDDGTGLPRLVVTFETYRKPNDEVCTLPGVTYSMADRRVGLNVPLNHQWVRKSKRVGVAGALVGVTKKLTAPKQTVSALFGLVKIPVETPEEAARREAYKEALDVVKRELNLNQPATSTLLTMPEGLQFWIVYGMPGAGGAR